MKLHPRAVFMTSLALGLLSGCSQSPFDKSWPVPPKELIELQPPVLGRTPDKPLQEAIKFGETLSARISTSYDDKNRRDWANGDFTMIGVVAAVAGVVSGQPGLMNTGAGMSALGTTASARYQYGSQRTIYEEGRKASDCVIGVAGRVNDPIIIWAANQTINTESAKVAQSFPDDVLKAFTTIQSRLITRLSALQNQPPNSSDFQKYFEKQVTSKALLDDTQRDLVARHRETAKLQLLVKAHSPEQVKALTKGEQDSLLDNRAQLASYRTEENNIPENRQQEYLTKIISAGPDLIACYAGF